MSLPRMRPTFVIQAACGFDELMRALSERMAAEPEGISGHFTRKNGLLAVTGEDLHFWSPVLDLTMTDSSELASEKRSKPEGASSVELMGVFSPRPEIWTALVFAIGTLTILSFISFFFAIAQHLSGQSPWVLWIPVVAVFLIVVLYGSALIGQGLAGDNMYRLRAYVDACVQQAEATTSRTRVISADASAQL